jgi:hypothetical protein
MDLNSKWKKLHCEKYEVLFYRFRAGELVKVQFFEYSVWKGKEDRKENIKYS